MEVFIGIGIWILVILTMAVCGYLQRIALVLEKHDKKSSNPWV